MRRFGRITALALGAALILIMAGGGLLPPLTPASAAASTSVSLTVPDRVLPGSNFTATVNITGVVNLDAATYDISVDPLVLKLNEVTAGSISGKVIPAGIWRERTDSPGTYTVVQNLPGLPGISPPNSSPVTGTGSLAVLKFQVIGSLSNSTPVNFSSAVLSSTNATAIPATWSGALIQAIPPATTVPASFSISDFSVSKREVGLGESVTVSVLVTNTGGSSGNYGVVLKVNGAKDSEQNVTLGAGQLQTVSFFVAKSVAGRYDIDVNGKTGQFTVAVPLISPPPAVTPPLTPPTPPVAPPSSTIPAPPGAPTPAAPAPPVASEAPTSSVPGAVAEQPGSSEAGASNTPEVTPSSPPRSPPPAPPPSLNWPVLGGIGGAVIIIGLIVFFAVSRRL
ncbi:MAG: cohesin domain-containing protein [Chloroflexota bacterium]